MSEGDLVPMSIHGETATEHASRYLQQLCKHWSHKAASDFDAERGSIVFDTGETVLMSARTDRLMLEVRSATAERATRFRDVVEQHIARFAFREALTFHWGDASQTV